MDIKQEPKYDVNEDRRIINRATGRVIPDDEPIFILRARDIHAAAALIYYSKLCNIESHCDVVNMRIEDFETFAEMFPDRMQEPGQYHGK